MQIIYAGCNVSSKLQIAKQSNLFKDEFLPNHF